MTDKLQLFFDEPTHKYTDNRGNTFTSVTTLIGKYYEKFDTKKMARICELSGKKGNPKYKGKTAKMLEEEWAKTSSDACDYGSEKHGYLEDSIKESTNFRQGVKGKLDINQLVTVEDIIENPGFGELNIEYFIQTKVNIVYPSIFALIVDLVQKGYRIYAELGVFNVKLLISGLIDLFLIRGNEFIILDWKTNKDDFTYLSGYWKKDNNGNTTTEFVHTNKTFKQPLSHLPDSIGHKYSLQLSSYAYMAELKGLVCKGLVLCHIRREMILCPITDKLVEKVDFHKINYLKEEVKNMMNDYYNQRPLNQQMKIMI